MIPFTDLNAQYATIKEEIDKAIKNVINDGRFILGPDVKLLEEEIAKYCGAKYGVGVASGTDALVLALVACGVKEGDEVITTPLTFIATAEAIVRAGAKPAFVDIDEKTYNIDANKIEECIKSKLQASSSKLQAIIPVHLYGQCADMDRILGLARKYNLKVIEDCAQSMGAEYLTMRNAECGMRKWKKAGSMGDAGALSFFPAKNLGCYGDGGMVVTDDKEIGEKIGILRKHGCKKKNYQIVHGFNSRLDTLHAAILRVKLKYLDGWIEKRRENAKLYTELFPKEVIPPYSASYGKHAFNYFNIRIKNGGAVRDKLKSYLQEKGISCGIYYPLSLHLQETYKYLGYKKNDFPICEKIQEEILSLPMFPELTHEQIKFIAENVKNFFNQK